MLADRGNWFTEDFVAHVSLIASEVLAVLVDFDFEVAKDVGRTNGFGQTLQRDGTL